MISIEDLLEKLIEASCEYAELLADGTDSSHCASYGKYKEVEKIKQEILNYIDLLKE